MRTPGQHTNGPANSYAEVHGPNYPDASALSKAPPECTPHKSKRAVSEWISNITIHLPLLSLPTGDRQPNGTCSYLLVILCISFLLCPLLYMYEDVRVRAVHLTRENAALEGEIHGLQTTLHDLRGRLTKVEELAFWEFARTMNTNMYVLPSPPLTLLMGRLRDICVNADELNVWSYGITNGLFNDSDPPITSTKHHLTHWPAVIIQSTDHRRIIGYKVESNGRNSGCWVVTGLMGFGQSGSHEVTFTAMQSISDAGYEVTVYYADRKL